VIKKIDFYNVNWISLTGTRAMSVVSFRIAQRFNGSHYGQREISVNSRRGSIISKGSKFSQRSNVSKLSKLQKKLIEEHEQDRGGAANRSRSEY
jgi:hypothetical protein